MVRKELRQIFRDPRLSRVIFIAPIDPAPGLRLRGVDRRPERPHAGRGPRPHGGLARAGARRSPPPATSASSGATDRPADARPRPRPRRGACSAVVIPPGFARDLAPGGRAVQLLFDGTNSNLATVARGYAERDRPRLGPHRRVPGAARARAWTCASRAWFNPDLESRDYNVPAVIGRAPHARSACS